MPILQGYNPKFKDVKYQAFTFTGYFETNDNTIFYKALTPHNTIINMGFKIPEKYWLIQNPNTTADYKATIGA